MMLAANARKLRVAVKPGVLRRLSYDGRRTVRDLASEEGELRVFIVAGEVSGDIIASRFMKSLINLSPFPVRFAGIGGGMMMQQGLNSLFPMEDISVMGIWELLPYLNRFRNKLRETVDSALVFQPHVVLTVDSKGFSFRFLKRLRGRFSFSNLLHSNFFIPPCFCNGVVFAAQCSKSSIPRHFHYVAPSFWAWKGGEARLKGLMDFVDHIFCILPFEEQVCRVNGLTATFVGHPTLEDAFDLGANKNVEWKVQGDGEAFRKKHGITSESTLVSVLFGSRLQEVTRMLPVFASTLEHLNQSFSELMAVIHVAPNQDVEKHINSAVSKFPVPVVFVPGSSLRIKYDSFNACRTALCASGTVAVELQLARLPCVVAYKAHFLTEAFIRYKAKVQHISLPNILLNEPVIPEALFGDCTPAKLAPLLMELMQDESLRMKQIRAADRFLPLLDPLGRPSCSRELAHRCTPSMIAASTVLNSSL